MPNDFCLREFDPPVAESSQGLRLDSRRLQWNRAAAGLPPRKGEVDRGNDRSTIPLGMPVGVQGGGTTRTLFRGVGVFSAG